LIRKAIGLGRLPGEILMTISSEEHAVSRHPALPCLALLGIFALGGCQAAMSPFSLPHPAEITYCEGCGPAGHAGPAYMPLAAHDIQSAEGIRARGVMADSQPPPRSGSRFAQVPSVSRQPAAPPRIVRRPSAPDDLTAEYPVHQSNYSNRAPEQPEYDTQYDSAVSPAAMDLAETISPSKSSAPGQAVP
jgi:hypothetical protein